MRRTSSTLRASTSRAPLLQVDGLGYFMKQTLKHMEAGFNRLDPKMQQASRQWSSAWLFSVQMRGTAALAVGGERPHRLSHRTSSAMVCRRVAIPAPDSICHVQRWEIFVDERAQCTTMSPGRVDLLYRCAAGTRPEQKLKEW